jgi:hypothetical protein
MDGYPREPASVTLDIDDTCDVVHGHQQLSLFNAHYDERCFLPIHVYDTEKSRPVAVVLRPGKTPGGVEVRAHLRRLIRHIRTRWHNTRITFRGDGHYARPEAMTWCENNGIDYIFGLSSTKPLAKKADEIADDIRTRRAIENLPVLRGYNAPPLLIRNEPQMNKHESGGACCHLLARAGVAALADVAQGRRTSVLVPANSFAE